MTYRARCQARRRILEQRRGPSLTRGPLMPYELHGTRPVPARWLFRWARRTPPHYPIAKTQVGRGRSVSTIFLGFDHGWGAARKLFESAVLTDRPEGAMDIEIIERYGTYRQAMRGHNRLVNALRGRG